MLRRKWAGFRLRSQIFHFQFVPFFYKELSNNSISVPRMALFIKTSENDNKQGIRDQKELILHCGREFETLSFTFKLEKFQLVNLHIVANSFLDFLSLTPQTKEDGKTLSRCICTFLFFFVVVVVVFLFLFLFFRGALVFSLINMSCESRTKTFSQLMAPFWSFSLIVRSASWLRDWLAVFHCLNTCFASRTPCSIQNPLFPCACLC